MLGNSNNPDWATNLSPLDALKIVDAYHLEILQAPYGEAVASLRQAFLATQNQANNLSGNDQPRIVTDRASSSLTSDTPLPSMSEVLKMPPTEFFRYFDKALDVSPRHILREQFQSWLDAIPDTTRTFEEFPIAERLEPKREFARDINTRSKALGCRLKCLDGTSKGKICGEPAGLSVILAGNSKQGLFYFSHQIVGKRAKHNQTTRLPQLVLIG